VTVAGHLGLARRTLILGTNLLARELVEAIGSQPQARYEIVGALGEPPADGEPPFPCPVLGSAADLERVIAAVRPERIVVALTERRRRLPADQLVRAQVFRSIRIRDGQEVYERLSGKIALDSLTPSQVVFSHDFLPHPVALAVARAISVLAAAAGLVVLAPLLALVALAIRLDSPGPVLFVQDRVGLRGRRFRMLKFRTMRPDAGPHTEWAADNGDRITRAGVVLRRFRLDELPQLVNILRGDMNLVGPRPHPATNAELFMLVSRNAPQCGAPIPYYELRSMLRPGITGWAQVRYRYANNLDEEMEKLRYDLWYIKHHSVWLDFAILLETFRIVLFGHRRAPPASRDVTRAPESAPRVLEAVKHGH
jgi:exopolysaccharide biosynthesis polyprenyl glycosylphosphotransferase